MKYRNHREKSISEITSKKFSNNGRRKGHLTTIDFLCHSSESPRMFKPLSLAHAGPSFSTLPPTSHPPPDFFSPFSLLIFSIMRAAVQFHDHFTPAKLLLQCAHNLYLYYFIVQNSCHCTYVKCFHLLLKSPYPHSS